jgi:hypothetical protein
MIFVDGADRRWQGNAQDISEFIELVRCCRRGVPAAPPAESGKLHLHDQALYEADQRRSSTVRPGEALIPRIKRTLIGKVVSVDYVPEAMYAARM